MNKYKITYIDSKGREDYFVHHSPDEEHALRVFRQNFGPHPEAKVEFLRPTSSSELEEINNTGGPSPRRRAREFPWHFGKHFND